MSHYVEVNECMVFATTLGADWWAAFRFRFEPAGRIAVVKASLGGDLLRVACDDREGAEWLAEHMVTRGLPRKAVKVGPRARRKRGGAS